MEQFLADHATLQRLNRQRREQELRDRLADDQPLTEALKSVIDNSPELRSLFGNGQQMEVQNDGGDGASNFIGVKFPTFFRLKNLPAEGQQTEFKCPLQGSVHILFETDATNDYFTRSDDPGTLLTQPEGVFCRMFLRNGRASLVVRCPKGRTAGDVINVYMEVTDASRTQPFVHRIKLHIVEERPSSDRDHHDQPEDRSGSLSLPKIVEVKEEDWEAEGFTAESGLTIMRDVDAGLIAKVNVDNRFLKASLIRAAAEDRDLQRKRFIYGLVLAGVSLWHEYKDRDEADDLIRSSTKAMARILLPTITVLGALEPNVVVND
jgi:hypothetical protein